MRTILFSFLILLTGCGGSAEANLLLKDCSVDLFGDSLLYGAGLESRPVEKMRKDTGATINDFSIPGKTLSTLIDNDAKSNSKVVVIELGGNDAFIPLTTDEYKNLVLKTIENFKSSEIIFVSFVPLEVIEDSIFWTPSVVSSVYSYNKMLLSMEMEYNLNIVRWDLVPYNGWQVDTIDGVHRTEKAIEQLLKPLNQAIIDICNKHDK